MEAEEEEVEDLFRMCWPRQVSNGKYWSSVEIIVELYTVESFDYIVLYVYRIQQPRCATYEYYINCYNIIGIILNCYIVETLTSYLPTKRVRI